MARRKLSELDTGSNAPQAASISSNGEPVGPAAAHSLSPVLGFAKGALNKTRETTSQPILRALAKMGLPSAQKEMGSIDEFRQNHIPVPGEKAGEFAADLGMLMAPTPFGKAGMVGRTLGAAAQGTAQHQAQNFAREGEVRPGEAVGEMALSTALPFAGQAVTKGAGILAPKILEGLTPKGLKGGANPPDWAYALRNKLVPYFKGAKGISATTAPKIAARDELRDRLLDESGSKVNIQGAIDKTIKRLKTNIGSEDADRITAGQFNAALPYGDDALLTAKRQVVTGKRAVGLRKLADDRAKKGAFENAPAEVASEGVFNKQYRDVLEDELLNSMRPKDAAALSGEISRAAKRGGPAEIDLSLAKNEAQKGRFGRYVANKKTLSKLTPIDIAAQDMAKQGHRLGTMIDLGIASGGIGSSFIGDNSPTPALASLMAIGARRGLSSPTGARALYDLSRGAADKTGRAGLNLARTGIFSHSENK